MATYYRWEQCSIFHTTTRKKVYDGKTSAYLYPVPNSSSYDDYYGADNEATIDAYPDKTFRFARVGQPANGGSNWVQSAAGTHPRAFNTNRPASYFIGVKNMQIYGQNNDYRLGDEIAVYEVSCESCEITVVGIVCSSSSSTYPEGDYSGNYYYQNRTKITINAPSSISVSPNPPKGGSNVSVSWGDASSDGGAISNYELSKRLDGGSWTVVGTYGSDTRAASVSVPAGTETIAFRVRAKDENGYWSDYRTSSTYTVKNNASPGAPESITVPETVYGGKETEISWAAASDPDGNLSGYILERQTDGGSWSQRYKGAGRSYADTVPFGTESVRYRVKAYDVENLSSGYTTSPTRSVVNAPDVPVLTVPELAMEGQTVPVSWTAATHATGYTLERKADTDEDWTQVYSGQALGSSETAGAWTAVQYRVKATGEEADSAWATSGEIPVVSASALVISGQDGDLGTLVNDVPYSVSSDTGEQISLELRVNGALWTALEVSSGYAQSIPVIDLPTGAGTIDILATVQASTGAVGAARAWTYTKTPVTTSAGPCDVVEWQDATGAVKFPVTLAEAVRIPGGKTLDQVIQFPAQICTGSYVGTGTYGVDDPTIIDAPFIPRLVIILYESEVNSCRIMWIGQNPTDNKVHCALNGTTFSVYAESAGLQANATGITYHYVVIGDIKEETE